MAKDCSSPAAFFFAAFFATFTAFGLGAGASSSWKTACTGAASTAFADFLAAVFLAATFFAAGAAFFAAAFFAAFLAGFSASVS